MKLQMKRIAAAMLATGMLLCAMPMTAFASDAISPKQGSDDNEPTYSTELKLKKKLDLGIKTTNLSDVPYADCSFVIAPAETTESPKVYGNGWIPAMGIALPTTETTKHAVFGPSESGITFDETYAVQGFSYDFSSILKSANCKAGYVYHYKITEQTPTPAYIGIDTNSVRYVDVFVMNAPQVEQATEKKVDANCDCLPNTLVIAKIICYSVENGKTCKSDGFTNTYCPTTLDLSKMIAGNQGDKTHEFNFTVIINTGVTGTVQNPSKMKGYTMHISGNSSSMVNGGTLTVGADGTAKREGKMTNASNIQITRIPKNSTYTITETLDGYVLTIDGATLNTDKNGCSGTVDANKIKFTNTKNGNIPTGVMLDVAPYALMVGLALAGLVAFTIRKRRVQ